MRIKSIILSVFLVCSFIYAISEENITVETTQKVDEVTKTLNDDSLTVEDKSAKVFELFDGFFDFERMASLSLGKEQWISLSEMQRQHFSSKFIQKLKQSFIEKLSLYTDEKIVVGEVEKPIKSRITLRMDLVDSDGKTYDIVFKFYDTKTEKEWLIYDVDVLGVSIIQTYRSQFDGVLQKTSFDELLKKIDTLVIEDNATK